MRWRMALIGTRFSPLALAGGEPGPAGSLRSTCGLGGGDVFFQDDAVPAGAGDGGWVDLFLGGDAAGGGGHHRRFF